MAAVTAAPDAPSEPDVARSDGTSDGARDGSGRSRVGTSAILTLAALLVPVAILAATGWSHRWMSDDGFINLRVVRQLLAGNGPVFNVGERVEAGTSPLWIVVLAVGDLVTPIRLEHLAVGIGLLGAVGGLALAEYGGLRLVRGLGDERGLGLGDERGLVVPLGALVIAVLPPFWDFATSGLELGLSVLWLAGSWLALVSCWRRAQDRRHRSRGLRSRGLRSSALRWGPPVLIGLGPLVRPDFAIFSACFLVVICVLRTGWWSRLAAVGVALVVPVAYEIFRLGYFGALAPNPALAKESGSVRWSQGLRYLNDFLDPYWLWIPLAVLLVVFGAIVVAAWRRDVRAVVLVVVPVFAGVVHGLYVVRVGGDFMHARLLLPSLFAVVLPVMVIRLSTRTAVVFGEVVTWAAVCAFAFGISYAGEIGPNAIADERGIYVAEARVPNPMTIADFRRFDWARTGIQLRDLADRGGRAFFPEALTDPRIRLPRRRSADPAVVARMGNIGIAGYAAGTDVFVVDELGLADAVAARVELVRRGVAGHEKYLPVAWALVRSGVGPGERLPAGVPRAEVEAARAALQCGDLADVVAATTAPLTTARFFENVTGAFRWNDFRFPRDPIAARRELCG